EVDRGIEWMKWRRDLMEVELHSEAAEPAVVRKRAEAVAGEGRERRADERRRREQGLRH
ncbi:hypothetical protein CRG98_043208, partial [Punica granatum]